MSARRFKGYAVRDDEGRWLGHVDSDAGIILAYGNKEGRRLWESAEDADEAAQFDIVSLNGFVLVPVFATRKPKPAPADCPICGEPGCAAPFCVAHIETMAKPAPAEGAAGGRYAVLCHGVVHGEAWFEDFDTVDDPTRHVGTREQAYRLKSLPHADAEVVRIFAEDEHEAVVEKARNDERQRTLADVRKALLARQGKYALDGNMDEATACQHAICDLDKLTETEAAKGQAK